MLRRTCSLIALSLGLLLTSTALAEAPPLLPVSGWLSDADGVPLDGEIDLTVGLYDVESGGTALFSDTVTVLVDMGFFTAYAGENSALDLALFAEESDLWLGLAVDEEAEMEPRALIATAPWAGWAEYAGIADDALALGGIDAADYLLSADDADTLVDLGCLDGQIVLYDGTAGVWECQDVEAASEVDPLFAASDAAGIGATDIGNWNTSFGWGDHSAAGYLTSYSETDPIYAASDAAGIGAGDIGNWNTAFGWGDHSAPGYLTSYTETDPVFSASEAGSIGGADVDSWNSAFGWGDHSAAGYLTSYTETDPVFGASDAAAVTAADMADWSTAYGWGDHAVEGYLTTETDPVFGASDAAAVTAADIADWSTAYGWGDHAVEGYLTTETDPVFGASDVAGITTVDITEWDDAYGWGDHGLEGYLTSEVDPLFAASAASGISSANVNNWSTAYGWGNHASAGYLTSYTETDPIYGASAASGISSGNISTWNTAYGWGNHASAGYLTSYTETDPIYGASAASGISSGNISTWNTAYGWGNHASAGYLSSYTETDPIYGASAASGISSGNISNWNTAYGWGNHASAGYLSSYTETDPIYGASAASGISTGNISNWNTAHGWGNHASAGYLTTSAGNGAYVNVSGDTMTGNLSISGTEKGLYVWNVASETESGITLGDAEASTSQFADIMYYSGSPNRLSFYVDSTTALMTLEDSQEVGIGTSTPSAKLDVVGTTELNGTTNLAGNTNLTSGRLDTNGRAWVLAAAMAHSRDDISGFSTLTGDDNIVNYDQPFNVEVDGTNYGRMCICTNGWIELTNATTCPWAQNYNYSLPTSHSSNPIIAAYWDDLEATGSNIRYGTVGSSPHRVATIDFETEYWSIPANDITFQVQIHEGSGLINVHYASPTVPAMNGQSATIGFQTAGGTSARAYPIVYNGKVLDDNRDDMSWSIAPVR